MCLPFRHSFIQQIYTEYLCARHSSGYHGFKTKSCSPILFFIYFYFYFFKILFIYLFMAVLGLGFCVRAFSSCGKRGPLFIVVRGPLTIAASLVAEHRLQTHRLSSCGSRA